MFWSTAQTRWLFLNSLYDKGLLARLQGVVDADFGHVTYTEAISILLKSIRTRFEYPVYWGCDLQTEHERLSNRRGVSSAPSL